MKPFLHTNGRKSALLPDFATGPERGMTLLELLLVVAVVVVLAALLFPTFRNVQESSRSAFCINNLRGIGTAFNLYAIDNDNLFPAARWADPEQNAERKARKDEQNPSGRNWQSEIQPYFSNGRSFAQSRDDKSPDRFVFCPTYFAEYRNNADLIKLQAAGYGMNKGLAKGSWDFRFKRTRIEDPANSVLIGDSDDYWLGITANMLPDEKGHYQNMASNYCGDPVRHNGRANYLFVDGHIRTLSAKEAAAFSYASNR